MGHKVDKVSTKPLEDLIKEHGLSVADVASRTRQSVSAIHQWRREKLMPGVMLTACDGIQAALGGDVKRRPDDQTLLVRVPHGQRERLDGFLEGIGAKYKPWTDPTDF